MIYMSRLVKSIKLGVYIDVVSHVRIGARPWLVKWH